MPAVEINLGPAGIAFAANFILASDMTDILHFFHSPGGVLPREEYGPNQLGAQIIACDDEEARATADIAIIGVCESRNAESNFGCSHAPDRVRERLYKLYPGAFQPRVVDLGNIMPGHTVEDTYFAVRSSVDYLVRNNVIPVIIGGSHDLTYPQFLGYKDLEQTINVVSVDSMMDLGNPEAEISNRSWLGKVILHQPNYLFNYSIMGYQTYLVDPQSLEMMGRLFFDAYRLGQIRDNIEEAEPVIRQADMLTFDFSVIKHSDAPGHEDASPNGLYAEEACQIMRYAGMNDKLSSLGIYEINPSLDPTGKTPHLAAQMIWCFLDGYYGRKNDYPNRTSQEYTRFHVFLQDEKYEINFYKSRKSDRWWMEIPYPPQKDLRFERHTLIPCSFKDYSLAINNEIPDRWWQTYQKLL
jgi:formiminoglutamase